MLFSLWAMFRVQSVYARYLAVAVRSGMTGQEVAQAILDRNNIRDVQIVCLPKSMFGRNSMGDHYNPLDKKLSLSEENYFGRSVSAVGVAAHECGHAIQHSKAYQPLYWRMAAVGITNYANYVVMFLPILGLMTGLIRPYTGILFMAVAWGIIMLFNLITLPVEFDASSRAKVALQNYNFIAPGEEADGVKKVLDAAAWTYVAAFLTSLLYFLYYLLPLLTGGNSRSRD